MSEIYVEGIIEDTISKFSKRFNEYGSHINIQYDDSPIRDVINEVMSKIDSAFIDCVDDVFDLFDEDLQESDREDLIRRIKQITNDF